ncbi:hypothetical protein B0I35DRAFT_517573 [Stachybotrys elegans]|uniref:Uncharacterized protein n=1 Tax=Stachybotrys elegans TaxID=80388 RepID=A0A8K0WIC7_9HYPO|nr:hypothetical protein B0I35DRAFT_517573 [Stachybotrys elegans]
MDMDRERDAEIFRCILAYRAEIDTAAEPFQESLASLIQLHEDANEADLSRLTRLSKVLKILPKSLSEIHTEDILSMKQLAIEAIIAMDGVLGLGSTALNPSQSLAENLKHFTALWRRVRVGLPQGYDLKGHTYFSSSDVQDSEGKGWDIVFVEPEEYKRLKKDLTRYSNQAPYTFYAALPDRIVDLETYRPQLFPGGEIVFIGMSQEMMTLILNVDEDRKSYRN